VSADLLIRLHCGLKIPVAISLNDNHIEPVLMPPDLPEHISLKYDSLFPERTKILSSIANQYSLDGLHGERHLFWSPH
jgi:hypothetical protein